MNIELRDYQEKALEELLEGYATQDCTCVVSPTGSGKTIIIRQFVAELLKRYPDKSICITTHRLEILNNIRDTLETIEAFGDANVSFHSIQKLTRNDDLKFDILIIDEAHHVTSKSYRKVISDNTEWHCGFTATPLRGLIPEYPSFIPVYKDTWKTELTGLVNEALFTKFITTISTAQLIKEGFLTDYKLVHDYNFHITHRGSANLDYTKQEIDEAITEVECVDYVKSTIKDQKAIVFCHAVDFAETVASMLDNSVVITSKTTKNDRDIYFDQYKNGDINVLIGVDIFSEGVDVPATDCVYLFRPTRSIPLFFQQIGRALRVSEGKTIATIYDYVNNYKRLGVEPKDIALSDMLLKTKFVKESCEWCDAYAVIEGDRDKTCGSVISPEITELSKWIGLNQDEFHFERCPGNSNRNVRNMVLNDDNEISTYHWLKYMELYHDVPFKYYSMPCVLNQYGRWEIMNQNNRSYGVKTGVQDCLMVDGLCKHSDDIHPYYLVLANCKPTATERSAKIKY